MKVVVGKGFITDRYIIIKFQLVGKGKYVDGFDFYKAVFKSKNVVYVISCVKIHTKNDK